MLAIQGGSRVVPREAFHPWPVITSDDRAAILAALDQATPWRWPFEIVTELEQAWADYVSVPHVLAANSGTAALHMCIAACDVEPGDEVIVPADTFLASASCVLQTNAIPVFVDTDPQTYNIDPALVGEAVSDRTRAVVAVDLHGLPADYAAIEEVARRHGLAVVEDGSQAHGATYRGRRVGSFGDVAACSLNGSKCLSALGEGGLFSCRDEGRRDLAARVLMFGEDPLPTTERDYDARILGWNYRIDVLAAAFARSQLRRLDQMTSRRAANGAFLTAALEGIDGVTTPFVPEDRSHVYFYYPVLVQPERLGIDVAVDTFRVTVKNALRAEGVPITEWQPRPIPGVTLFQDRRGYGRGCPWTCGHTERNVEYHSEDFPVASDVCRRRLVIGQSLSSLGPPNGEAQMALVAEAFHKVFSHVDDLISLATTADAEDR